MRVAVLVLLVLSTVVAVIGRTNDFNPQLREYQDHASRNFLARKYIVIYQGNKQISGFGDIEARQGLTFDFVAGRAELDDAVNLDSCKYKGYNCYWLDLAGKKYYPENTDSVSVNGMPGLPEQGTWRFRIEDGAIRAFSRLPDGSPDSAIHKGRGFPLAKKKDRKQFRDQLREVPEAYAAWNADPLGAIRYFNRAANAERVSDKDYEGGNGEEAFPAVGALSLRDLKKRIGRNPNDVFALGRMFEYHCSQREFQQAEQYADKLRGIAPDHFRLHLVRAYCEELQGNRAAAMEHYERAVKTAPGHLVPGIFASLKTNAEKKRFDSLYVEKSSRRYFFAAELGFGMPYALLGVGISLNARLKGFMLGLSLAEGAAQGAGKQGTPALGLRLFFPGEKWIPYLGFWDFAVFDGKVRDSLRYIGAGAGMAWDIGNPFGFRFHFGGGLFHTPSYIDDEGERRVVEDVYIPHVGFSYVF